jgi:hypothetical protein
VDCALTLQAVEVGDLGHQRLGSVAARDPDDVAPCATAWCAIACTSSPGPVRLSVRPAAAPVPASPQAVHPPTAGGRIRRQNSMPPSDRPRLRSSSTCGQNALRASTDSPLRASAPSFWWSTAGRRSSVGYTAMSRPQTMRDGVRRRWCAAAGPGRGQGRCWDRRPVLGVDWSERWRGCGS